MLFEMEYSMLLRKYNYMSRKNRRDFRMLIFSYKLCNRMIRDASLLGFVNFTTPDIKTRSH